MAVLVFLGVAVMSLYVLNYISTVVLAAIAAVALAKEWRAHAAWARITLALLLILSTSIGVASNYVATREANANEQRRTTVGKISTAPHVKPLPAASEFPQVQIGTSDTIIRFIGPANHALFRIFEHDAIRFDREDGQTKVSALIRDKSGRIVAELVKNEWRVNPSNAWDRNYAPDALEVRDNRGDVVLQVRALPDRIQMQAKLHDALGNGVALLNPRPGERGGVVELTGPQHPELTGRIEPMFKYPSDLHLGEFADTP